MEKKKILITQNLLESGQKLLKDTFETIFLDAPSKEELLNSIKDAAPFDGLICTPNDQIDTDLIQKLPESVKVISTYSVGFEHIDLEAAQERGITITHTPNVLTDATADIAMLLLLCASRRALEGDRMVREGKWTGWAPTQLLGLGLQGKRLGILGMGRIGEAFAKRAAAFGMEIHYHNRKPSRSEVLNAIYHPDPNSLLEVSDVLSLHFPLTQKTRKFLNAERIEMLPENAIVINTARGGVVDDEALIAALKCGRIYAAGLDVFDGEPHLHQGYKTLDNVYLLPHLGSATQETRHAMVEMVLRNLTAVFTGQNVPNRLI